MQPRAGIQKLAIGVPAVWTFVVCGSANRREGEMLKRILSVLFLSTYVVSRAWPCAACSIGYDRPAGGNLGRSDTGESRSR